MESGSSLFLCQPCSDDDGSILNGIKVKVVANHDDNTVEMMISEWLQSLTSVELSDDYWLNEDDDDILSTSIGSIIDKDYIQMSHIAQRLFESLPINKITRAQLFPTEEIRKAFDTNLIAALHTIIDDEIVSRRTSNKHPLKIQFLA